MLLFYGIDLYLSYGVVVHTCMDISDYDADAGDLGLSPACLFCQLLILLSNNHDEYISGELL